nr:uncharacterized protein LOC129385660 [Dermacentor andersoni]
MAELPNGDDNEICSLHSDSDNSTNQSSDGSYTSSDDDDDCEPRAGELSASELEEPLYQDAKLSRSQSLVMVMAHSLRHHSSKEATESLLQLIDAHMPEGTLFPKTKFLFFKSFSSLYECERVTHAYCSECLEYLTALPCATAEVQCSKCSLMHKVEDILGSGSFFLTVDIDSQVKELLLSGKISRHRSGVQYDVKDITQSASYNKLPMTEDDISVTWNTDGVPLFESSGHSVWPLLLQVNELPYKERVNKLLLYGLWFGAKKPRMNTFLRPFTQTMNRLSSEGISWFDEGCSLNKTCRVYPGPCSVDTVARCMLMNMTQFNGAYGCAWCEHTGEVVEKGRGHTRVFAMQEPAAKLRTDGSFLRYAQRAQRTGEPCRGIKGPSILSFMAFFSFSTSFVVDYMHAVCNGFVRTTAFMWFNNKRGTGCSLRRYLPQIDERLKQLTPVWEMNRLPRSLTEMKFWKASEWRDWLLYYSPFVLKDFPPSNCYRNWTKFVVIMHFCLQSTVPMDKIPKVKELLIEFLREYEHIYGKECMTYNSHILVHMVDNVRQWGPLWSFSAYPFESMNGKLVRFVNGTRYAHLQIIEKFCILQSLPQVLSATMYWQNKDLKSFVKSLLKGYKLRKTCIQVGNILLYGKGIQEGTRRKYRKATVGAFTYCVAAMDKSRRRNSYIVANDSVFGHIIEIFTSCASPSCSNSDHVLFKVKKLLVRNVFLACIGDSDTVPFVSVEETSEHASVRASDVKKCIVMRCAGMTVLSVIHEGCMLESN